MREREDDVVELEELKECEYEEQETSMTVVIFMSAYTAALIVVIITIIAYGNRANPGGNPYPIVTTTVTL
jgi:hypothetical protein